MKQFAPRLRAMLANHLQPDDERDDARRIQQLLDELEDPPPNSLLVNLATGFPSALLCVLAAGALAGALAGRHVGGANFVPASGADEAPVVLALRQAPPPAGQQPSLAAVGVLAGRQAQLDRLEQQALQPLSQGLGPVPGSASLGD